MVKSVVGEESRLQPLESRLAQSATPSQVGLVIGKLSPNLDRGFIFDLIPTPANDAGDPPCSIAGPKDEKKKGASKAKTSSVDSSCLIIDKDWVAEHARQVSRMLVGGLKIVGIYVWVGETTFKNSTIVLCQTIQGVADVAPLSQNGVDERLLVHISYSPRRWTCRNCSLASNITSSSLRPCDFKMGKVLNSLQAFRCIYKFDIRMPIGHEKFSEAKTLNDVLHQGVSNHAKELKNAKALVDGGMVKLNEDEPCTSEKLHEVELLLPFMKDASLEASSQKEVVGVLVFSGTVCSYSYLNSKELVSQAVADIKEDITMSLRSRLDMLSDEAERVMTATAEEDFETNSETPSRNSVYHIIVKPLRKEFTLPFPRRVFVPWLASTFICDYLLPSETFEALKDHFVELLSMEAPADASLLEPESELPTLTTRSFWDMAAPSYQATDASVIASKSRKNAAIGESKGSSTTAYFNGIVAGFILLIAIMIGSLLYVRSSS